MPCAWALWLPGDVRDYAAEITGPLTDAQVEETLSNMQKRHDASVGLNWDVLVACIPDDALEKHVDMGPLTPVDGLLHLTEDQFNDRYHPELDSQGGLYRQREWSNPEDLSVIKQAIDENRCWTAIEDDAGDWCLVWGNRTVNRLYNVITEKPIEDPDWEVIVLDDFKLERAF
jgi:hypothetical protein